MGAFQESTICYVGWDGYLLAPRSGDFTFSIETDSGVRVFLNQQPIIVDRMLPATEADAVGDKIVPLTAVAGHPGRHTTESVPVELTAGEKYKLRVELVHTSHFKYENADSAYLNGEKAFADSGQFVVADVPQRYQGMKMIRGPSDPAVECFEFSANMPVNVYVASPVGATLPLAPSEKQPWTAHDTGDDLSVYRGTNPLSLALDSSRMKIRKIIFPEGGLISFNVTDKGVQFLLFLEGRKENALSCGGQQQVLSLVGGPTFAECEASSELSEEFGCRAALNGKNMDVKNGVRAAISQMYVNGEDSGGSFEFLGTACSLPEEGTTKEDEAPKIVIDDCRTNFWSLSVPENGRYRVEVQLGNPCLSTAANNYLQVNGTPVAQGVKLETGRFYVAIADLDVKDKIIVLSSLCDATGNTKELCTDAVTTILNVIIEKKE
ncbi:hypothetical protein NCLIV_029050 [Neospora caninum Liverpool]|uniref:PA14 domain-containing protein n=1 Tax=Neospora caninum (strain Liverpool) TaxID=572307 RepID=F0VHC3_NEOCL|nr:hypothetical protein NCLIV_029050 [Neospora caninum Liverpool]CBZ53117.1 hypothetical protein NCLIV_029050 [Neospora caninum Liverpool]|eukprot:XP_003883149.1 hypothetical protein NCLIV_029050 [Neospora caninum Liverpool]